MKAVLQRFFWSVCAGLVLSMLLAGSAAADLWSSSDSLSSKTAAKPVKKEPSALQKIGTGTKNLFTKVGNTITGKKTPPKKSTTQHASWNTKSSSTSSAAKTQKKSWLGSMFQPDPPKPKAKSPTDWIGQERVGW